MPSGAIKNRLVCLKIVKNKARLLLGLVVLAQVIHNALTVLPLWDALVECDWTFKAFLQNFIFWLAQCVKDNHFIPRLVLEEEAI